MAVVTAPYGGLFFHRSLTARIGWPRVDFYLYEDDSEYTLRLTDGGGTILMVPSSVVSDIDESGRTGKSRVLPFWLSAANVRQVEYGIRNRVYFERTCLVRHSVAYLINMLIYLAYLCPAALFTGRVRRYARILKAVAEGWRGRLGRIGD